MILHSDLYSENTTGNSKFIRYIDPDVRAAKQREYRFARVVLFIESDAGCGALVQLYRVFEPDPYPAWRIRAEAEFRKDTRPAPFFDMNIVPFENIVTRVIALQHAKNDNDFFVLPDGSDPLFPLDIFKSSSAAAKT